MGKTTRLARVPAAKAAGHTDEMDQADRASTQAAGRRPAAASHTAEYSRRAAQECAGTVTAGQAPYDGRRARRGKRAPEQDAPATMRAGKRAPEQDAPATMRGALECGAPKAATALSLEKLDKVVLVKAVRILLEGGDAAAVVERLGAWQQVARREAAAASVAAAAKRLERASAKLQLICSGGAEGVQ